MSGGMSRFTGKWLEEREHVAECLEDILTTPLGSRMFRRDYGSRLFDLLDAPVNQSWAVDVYAAVFAAVSKWEPRFELRRVGIENVERLPSGVVTLALEGILKRSLEGVRYRVEMMR